MIDILCMAFIFIPIILFIYSLILYKKKKVIYSIGIKSTEVVVEKFYRLQLTFCIINVVALLLEVFVFYGEINTNIFILIYVMTFWFISYLLKFISMKKIYIKIK